MVSDEEKKMTEDGRFRELSPGKLLIWGRERAGLTQEQVAKELYMTLTKVRALELDDYRHMGSNTFARGYLRSYANLVKLDVVQVLAAYDRHTQKHGVVEEALPRKMESSSKPLWHFAVLIVIVLLVLWLISVWFFDNRKEPEYAMPATMVNQVEPVMITVSSGSAKSEVIASSEAADSFVKTTVSSSYNSSGEEFSSTESSGAAPGVSSVNELASSSASTMSFVTAHIDQISFLFAEECWLEVSDSRGDVLVADLQPAGGRLMLQGKAPFDVKLGNAPAVQIELNNEKIAVIPALGTNVLNMKVGEFINE